MKASRITILILLLTASTALADELTFFGQDLGQGESIRLSSHPLADEARASFFSHLIGVGTENFEGFANGTGAPLVVNFGAAGSATLNGNGNVSRIVSGTNGVGRYPISGDNYWEASNVFTIHFSDPVAAFGFYGIDIGDFDGQVTLGLSGGTTKTLNIGNSTGILGGSVVYYGLIETGTFTDITFGNTAAGTDFFGFDDFSVGSLRQVQTTLPEPSAYLLLATAIAGLAAGARRKLRS